MSDLNTATLESDRLALAAKVDAFRNELATATDEIRTEKAADFSALVDQLQNVDEKFRLAQKAEQAEKLVKSLSNQPNRPQPVSTYTPSNYKAATIDPRTGRVVDAGDLESRTNEEALTSHEYSKAFQALLAAKGKMDRVKSANHRNMLEEYGKGGENLAENEVFMPGVGFYNKATTLGTTANGSNWVAPDFRFDPITQRTITPVAMRLCNVITTNVSTVTFPRNITDGNADSGRLGLGFNANFSNSTAVPIRGEQPAGNLYDTGPFDQLTITARTGTMPTDVSADLWADVPGFASYLQNQVQKMFAARMDSYIFSPTQISNDAEAILANSNVFRLASGANGTLGNATATAATGSIYDNLNDLFYSFRDQYGSNLAWVYNRSTHGKIQKVKDSTGQPILTSFAPGTFSNTPVNTMFGAPIYFAEYMQASGSTGAKSILVGDFNEYYLLMRQGFTVVIDDLSQQFKNNIRVNFKYRFGGAVRDWRAFAYLAESAT